MKHSCKKLNPRKARPEHAETGKAKVGPKMENLRDATKRGGSGQSLDTALGGEMLRVQDTGEQGLER